MKSIFRSIKSFFEYSPKEIVSHFLGQELNDLNSEILQNREYLRKLERKRERLELMVYGN